MISIDEKQLDVVSITGHAGEGLTTELIKRFNKSEGSVILVLPEGIPFKSDLMSKDSKIVLDSYSDVQSFLETVKPTEVYLDKVPFVTYGLISLYPFIKKIVLTCQLNKGIVGEM